MVLVNCAIIAKFMKAKCQNILQNSTESTSQALNKYATKGTAMVVTVSVTFIILTAPVSVNTFTRRKLRIYPLYYVFMISMQYINHSINCVLYCIVGTKFREELIKLFKCQRKTSGVNYQQSTTDVSTVTTWTLSNIENISTMLSRRTFLIPWSSSFQITLIMPATFSTSPLDASQHRNICL